MVSQLLGVVLALGALYGAVEAWPLMAGPSLHLKSPSDYLVVEDGILTVAGSAARAARLTINGGELPHEPDGSFSTLLAFPKGTSILTFEATDRFGRTARTTRSIYVP